MQEGTQHASHKLTPQHLPDGNIDLKTWGVIRPVGSSRSSGQPSIVGCEKGSFAFTGLPSTCCVPADAPVVWSRTMYALTYHRALCTVCTYFYCVLFVYCCCPVGMGMYRQMRSINRLHLCNTTGCMKGVCVCDQVHICVCV